MSAKFSTGLRANMLAVGSLRTALNGGELRLYSGPVPASADSAINISNTVLCVIKTDTLAGLTFEATAPGGILTKTLTEVWQGTVDVSGTATFFRFVTPSDTNVGSTALSRIQGTVALIGGDLNISNTALTDGAVQRIEAFSIAMAEE